MEIFARSPKTRIFWKSAMGDQGKFLKNRPKSTPRLKRPKAHWRKWHYPLISMHLNWRDWRRFRRKQRLKKCPNGQVMSIFGTSPKTRIFRKSAKKRPREVFQISPIKKPSLQWANSTRPQMSLSSKLYLLITQRLKKILAQKAAPKLPEWLSYGNSGKVTQNPHFLKKCKGGTKETF